MKFCLLSLVFGALVVAGCSHAPKVSVKKVPFDMPQSWTKIENAEQGIAIACPPGWKIGTTATNAIAGLPDLSGMGGTTGGDMSSMGANLEKANEEKAKQDVKDVEKDGIYISCIDRSTPTVGEERTRFNVFKKSMGGNAQMDDVIKEINEQLTNEDPPQPIDLPIGKATKVHSHQTLKDGGEVTRIYYGIVDGENIYIVRYITEQNGLNIDEIATQGIKTLRIGK